ncbi:MAG TPA: hydrogen peroxide-dependent heme synthase [Clostridia bacterium]|nr:hydrogen peroxide-dependent heme synthase [Clostridia bacterium]
MNSRHAAAPSASAEAPAVPLTLEGSSVLHQMMRFRWAEWRRLTAAERSDILRELNAVFGEAEAEGASGIFSLLGHKGDLMFVHFRKTLDELNAAQLKLNSLRIQEFLEPASSYVSVVELSLHDSSVKLYASLSERGVVPHSEEWNREVQETVERQQHAMSPRLFPKIPDQRYICFYPMDRRRGEHKNWYTLPIDERQRQMDLHGMIGRRYAGRVQQIISGSIGYDDWEWGVDLFGNDPVVFKKLIYEMRFDEVSGVYSNFGTFYIGVRVRLERLGDLFEGKVA